MIKSCVDRDSAMSFDDLIIELFENRENTAILKSIENYIIKNKYDYCLTHLLTLHACCIGYLQKNKAHKTK